jgi:hypothetical protein
MQAAASGRALAGDNSTAHLGERRSAPHANVRSPCVHIIDHLADVALLIEKRWTEFEPTHVLHVFCLATAAPQTLMREKNSDGRVPPIAQTKLATPAYIFEIQIMAKL